MALSNVERSQLPIDRVTRAEFQATLMHARTNKWPEHWPEDVRSISLNGLSLIGLDHKGNMYLDGERLYTERRLARQERVIAWSLVFFTAMGAIATAAPLIFGK